jgi:predicted AlkP superfamily phosphohydrolase/phosphomutase
VSANRLSSSSSSLPRASLEGFFAGGAAGAVLTILERSPTYHVLADVLNRAFRFLSGRLDQASLIRLDTEGVAMAAYVGGHAILGTILGAGLGAIRPGGRSLPAGLRWVAVAGLLFVFDTLVFGAVWRHRGLSYFVGATLVGVSAAAALGAAGMAGLVLPRLLPPRRLAGLALVLPLVTAFTGIGIVLAAVRGPARPEGRTLAYPRRAPTDLKVALLGVDGLDGVLVDEAIAEGRLPNLARLIAEGTRGDLRSIRPPMSPVVWTSMATGMLPRQHGITGFVVRRGGESVPVTGNLRRSPALWNMAKAVGFTVAFVNWYVTWPAEEVPGVMISDRVDFDGLDRRVWPRDLTPRIDSARARAEVRPDRDAARFTRIGPAFEEWRANRWGQVRRALGILDDVIRHDLVTLETAREALRDGQPDLTALYFRGNDNTQHLYWKYRLAARDPGNLANRLYEDISEEDMRLLSPVVDRYYDSMDEMLGEALALLEPGTAVIILSDHGFLTNNERSRWYHPNRLLAEAGLCTLLPGEGGLADPAASEVLDEEAPSVDPRRRLRAGAAAAAPEEALESAREVLAGARSDAGAPLFRSLETGEDENGPYLRVVFAVDVAGRTARIAGRRVPFSDFRIPEGHSGDHRMNGLIVASGPPFRSGEEILRAHALDVAPTVLHVLGAPAGRDMEGVVLTGLFEPDWLEEHPIRYVESYGLREQESTEAIPTEADEKIREELRALGYIR